MKTKTKPTHVLNSNHVNEFLSLTGNDAGNFWELFRLETDSAYEHQNRVEYLAEMIEKQDFSMEEVDPMDDFLTDFIEENEVKTWPQLKELLFDRDIEQYKEFNSYMNNVESYNRIHGGA